MDHFTKLWQDFSKLPNVVAIALGGSRSGDSFDQSSDYDLYVYCAATPDITVVNVSLTSTVITLNLTIITGSLKIMVL